MSDNNFDNLEIKKAKNNNDEENNNKTTTKLMIRLIIPITKITKNNCNTSKHYD